MNEVVKTLNACGNEWNRLFVLRSIKSSLSVIKLRYGNDVVKPSQHGRPHLFYMIPKYGIGNSRHLFYTFITCTATPTAKQGRERVNVFTSSARAQVAECKCTCYYKWGQRQLLPVRPRAAFTDEQYLLFFLGSFQKRFTW